MAPIHQTCENCDGLRSVREMERPQKFWRPVISAPVKSQDVALPVRDLSFEAALKELETIVARLEQGEVDLEDSIALYERGQALKGHCEAKLKSAESRLEKIVQGAGGPAVGERLDVA